MSFTSSDYRFKMITGKLICKVIDECQEQKAQSTAPLATPSVTAPSPNLTLKIIARIKISDNLTTILSSNILLLDWVTSRDVFAS